MLEELGDRDWQEVFKYAGENEYYRDIVGEIDHEEDKYSSYHGSPRSALPGDKVSTEPFARDDVAVLYGTAYGENDGDEWVCYGKLRDGRYFVVSASCDYTGWGCQEGGDAAVSNSREGIEMFGLTRNQRERFNIGERD